MNQEVLQSLRDVHLPPPPSFWPPSLPLSLLVLAIVLSVVCVGWRYFAGRQRRKIKKFLMGELLIYKNQYLNSPDQTALQSQICALIRRVIILKNTGKNVSAISLRELRPELKQLFPRSKNLDTFMELATKNRFQKDPNIDAQHLINLALEHFKKCRI